jgi:hypothetical protein
MVPYIKDGIVGNSHIAIFHNLVINTVLFISGLSFSSDFHFILLHQVIQFIVLSIREETYEQGREDIKKAPIP